MIDGQSVKLAKLVCWEMVAFIVFEIILGALIVVNVFPKFLVVKPVNTGLIEIHSGFILIVSLIILLAAAIEIAILEMADIIEIKNI